MKKFILASLLLSLFILGCNKSNKSEDNATAVCDTNSSLALKATTLKVSQNTLDVSTDIINDMNATLKKIDRMNEAIYETMKLSAQTLEKIAEPFQMSNEGSQLFYVDSTPPIFMIKQPLLKNYILVSSPSRFFPDFASVKTLFNNPITLSSAITRAYTQAEPNKNLYITILQVESNATLTNLTNGMLIKSSQLP